MGLTAKELIRKSGVASVVAGFLFTIYHFNIDMKFVKDFVYPVIDKIKAQ